MADELSKYINVDSFITEVVSKNNLGFINRFVCRIFKKDKNDETFSFHCLSCDVPNISLGFNEQELFGERRYSFTKREDSDFGITFLDTADLKIRNLFDDWLLTAHFIDSKGVTREYPDSVQGAKIEIIPLDNFGKSTIGDIFTGVIPYDISGISYTYSDTELIKTTIKFKYKYHYISKI